MIIRDFSATVPFQLLETFQVSWETCLFFDIETTGLSWKRSHLYLLGAVFYDGSAWILRQWFCQKPAEEKEVLVDFARLLKEKKTLIHFNGTTFDLPYLMHKYTFYQLTAEWDHHPQLDLYQKFLPFKKILGLEHLRQKDLERYIGLHRQDPFTGKELIACYQEYLKTGDVDLEHVLLLHNKEDLQGMLSILPLLSLPRLFAGAFDGTVRAVFSDTMLDLIFSDPLPLPLTLEGENEQYHFQIRDGHISLQVPVFQGALKYFFPDYQNYYYLPLEDKVIHKSIGAFVDKEHREKAKASNCYQKQEGKFLPQFTELFTPAFRMDYKTKNSWFLPKDLFLADPSLPQTYACHLLSHFFQK